MEFRFRYLVRRFEAFRFKAGDHSNAIGRTRRDAGRLEVFSGTSISQGAQSLGDGHGQFALSGGPRIAQRGGPVEPVLLLDKEDFDDSNTKKDEEGGGD